MSTLVPFCPRCKAICSTCNPPDNHYMSDVRRIQVLLNVLVWNTSKHVTWMSSELGRVLPILHRYAAKPDTSPGKDGASPYHLENTDQSSRASDPNPACPADLTQSCLCINGHVCDICRGGYDINQRERDNLFLYRLSENLLDILCPINERPLSSAELQKGKHLVTEFPELGALLAQQVSLKPFWERPEFKPMTHAPMLPDSTPRALSLPCRASSSFVSFSDVDFSDRRELVRGAVSSAYTESVGEKAPSLRLRFSSRVKGAAEKLRR